MANECETSGSGFEAVAPPFLYEIHVKSHLTPEQWTSWFDDLSISTSRDGSTLRGRVPDHAALYALLARLRDLAVRVLDADAQLKLLRERRRRDLLINLLLTSRCHEACRGCRVAPLPGMLRYW